MKNKRGENNEKYSNNYNFQHFYDYVYNSTHKKRNTNCNSRFLKKDTKIHKDYILYCNNCRAYLFNSDLKLKISQEYIFLTKAKLQNKSNI